MTYEGYDEGFAKDGLAKVYVIGSIGAYVQGAEQGTFCNFFAGEDGPGCKKKIFSAVGGEMWYNKVAGRGKTINREGEERARGAVKLSDTVSKWSSISARLI